MRTGSNLPFFATIACAFLLVAGCASRTDRRDDANARAVPQPPPPDPAAQTRAREVAKDAEAKAKRTEKAEGKENLVKDEVAVKTDAQGKTIVEQKGEASWYGKFHHGRETASGERFDQRKLTAAHPTLPLGTKATVTNLDTGKSIEVIINDRGPYTKGRDLDLSKAAAQELGVTNGAAPVRIDAVVTPAPDPQRTNARN